MPLPKTYTAAEVAAAFRITPTALRRLVRDGKVRPMRLSTGPRSPMRFTEKDVDQLVKVLTPEPPPVRERRRRRAS